MTHGVRKIADGIIEIVTIRMIRQADATTKKIRGIELNGSAWLEELRIRMSSNSGRTI
jgi:hypothetical protein